MEEKQKSQYKPDFKGGRANPHERLLEIRGRGDRGGKGSRTDGRWNFLENVSLPKGPNRRPGSVDFYIPKKVRSYICKSL